VHEERHGQDAAAGSEEAEAEADEKEEDEREQVFPPAMGARGARTSGCSARAASTLPDPPASASPAQHVLL
jgi:hypothetical protein